MSTQTNNETLLSLVSDFRDIEDSIIWTIHKLNEYDAPVATKLAEDLLREIIRYKSENVSQDLSDSSSRNG